MSLPPSIKGGEDRSRRLLLKWINVPEGNHTNIKPIQYAADRYSEGEVIAVALCIAVSR